MVRWFFFLAGALLMTFLLTSWFPILASEAFTLRDFSVKGWMLLAIGLLFVAGKFGGKK